MSKRKPRNHLWRAVDQDGDVIDILVQRKSIWHMATGDVRLTRPLVKTGWRFNRPLPDNVTVSIE